MDNKERGHRTKAGKLLSSFIRQIAGEVTEFVKDPDGEDRMVTKAEKLARIMWKEALGCEEEQDVYKDGVKTGTKKITHRPDKSMIGLLWDRIEGRAPLMSTDDGRKLSAAERVTEQGKKRIGKAGDLK